MALMETLDIPEIYSRFDEYLAIEADDELDSVLVCNIRFCMICCEGKFLTSLDDFRILFTGKHWNNTF